MAATKTKREGPGFYAVSDGERTVSVIHNTDLAGPDKWMASARWDRHCYTDPLPTKRDAVECARCMLVEAAGD